MKAAQLTAPGQVEIRDLEPPAPAGGQVLLKVLACGLCGSDLNAWRGVPGIEYPLAPGLPGHEVWGEVAALGPGVDGPDLVIGRKLTGLASGGYAQYVVAPADELVAVPARFGEAVILGEPLACATNVARRSGWEPGQRVAVVGFGYLAALVAQLLFARDDGRWMAISRRPESRALALDLGAEAAFGFDAVPPELWDSFPLVIEVAGVQQSLDCATWLTAPGGRLVIAGYHADGPRTVNLQSWNWKGIDVINAHERQPAVYLRGLRDGLGRAEAGGLDLPALISHRWPLESIGQALATADRRPGGYVKGVVLPWSR